MEGWQPPVGPGRELKDEEDEDEEEEEEEDEGKAWVCLKLGAIAFRAVTTEP